MEKIHPLFCSIVLATASYTKLSVDEERASASLYRRIWRLAINNDGQLWGPGLSSGLLNYCFDAHLLSNREAIIYNHDTTN